MKSSLVYSLHGFEYNDPVRTFRETVEQIQLAEQLGFDAALITEHHVVETGYFPAPLITATAVGMSTSRIRVGPGVLLLPLYDPLHVAEHGAMVDIVTEGRLILAVGYGYRQEEFDAFKVKLSDRPGRLTEGIRAIRSFWTDEVTNFEGKHFQYKNVHQRPQPIQKPHPPIWMAAKQEGAVRAAARVADCWFADPVTPSSVQKDRLRAYKETLAEVGKPTRGFDFPVYREAFCAESDEKAWEQAKDGVMFIYQEYLDWGHMLDEQGRPVPPKAPGALDMLRKRFIIGSPETCIREALRVKEELEGTNLVMRMKFPGIPQKRVLDSIRLWGEKVIPAIA
jgi:alkanesulfonate monooxygenase SsuD/methylene tetrahydromethanopterin reductase-like flavin-dependent oxidoreductase (luciferase family)